MSWSPINLSVLQYSDANGEPYSGAVLKAYASGTSTPISMATDSTGGTTVGSVALNASGYPAVSGNVIIPHVAVDYKLALYPTQAAADANTGALWSVDAIGTISASTGAALVGADDGSSGSLWTTVAGFITKLLSSAGSSVVGFIQAGTGAVATTVQAKLRDLETPVDFSGTGTKVLSVRAATELASTFGLVFGKQNYPAQTIGAGSVLVDAYGSSRLPGTRTLRAIVAGYDNEITAGTGGDSGGLACSIWGGNHSSINNTVNHCAILGGSYNTINHGNYSNILGGTRNTLTATVTANPHNSVIAGGSLNVLDGANSAIVGGTTVNITGSGVVAGGQFNTLTGGDNTALFGYGTTAAGVSSLITGYGHTLTGFNYSSVVGRNHTTSGAYLRVAGRQALGALSYGDYYGYGTGGTLGTNQRVSYRVTGTTTNATPTNLGTVAQGTVGPAGITGTIVIATGLVTAKTSDGADYAAFEIKLGFKYGASTAYLFNTTTTLGASAGAAAWACAFGNNVDARVIVTGAAGVSIKWDADVSHYIASFT